ncbi:enoyl-CoA-hydratase DpgD [Nocardiopsis dassonvillei]|uniref:enoyl-CoA-hydratase DpgD n=1 Tax=Nocardiopsis dassonvillei TaxID=2014 RepID=UPI00200C847A|nr:enoyl-CoA-hydratase DpgD [Nocardiopsis dassonvillei]MCK9873766.1 enoyl-CoA hydratase-related protein [Nocardiopsis dassonvillei]
MEPDPEGTPRVLYEKKGRVAHVTLNRPEVLNAMDMRTHEMLSAVWDDVEKDDDVWVIVLTGAGERAFSTGQDLKERADLDEAGIAPTTFGSRNQPGWPRFTERFALAKPVVAKVAGYALGGGFELALACDIIVASEDAEFGLPEARLGLVPGAGGVFRLVRQMPQRIALGYLLSGRRISASRAFDLGLVNEVAPRQELDERVDTWVEDLLCAAPLSVRAIKEAAMRSVDMPLEHAFATRFVWEERRMHSEDAREGPRAFTEKRRPRWSGH